MILSTFSSKVTEYDSIAPFNLSPEIKKLKLTRCIAGDEHPINSMSTLCIATWAAGKAKPKYNDYMEALTEACNTHDVANIGKKHANLHQHNKYWWGK